MHSYNPLGTLQSIPNLRTLHESIKPQSQWVSSFLKLSAAVAAKPLQSCLNSVRPLRRQPTRLPRSWDSPGKNTEGGCHFLLQCVKVKIESEVAQSCLTHSDPMDLSLSGSSIHGIFQARVLEWGAIAFSVEAL